MIALTIPEISTEHLRPLRHFTPADKWMNDPNGLVHLDGTYHLFFQTNPEALTWGNMSWGHATSTDLLNWQEHDIALRRTQEETMFSGSIVVDHDNTSGLGIDGQAPLVAVYTSNYEPGSPRHGTQAQSVAYSLDSGWTWRFHADNPVLCRASPNFRDPKVFRHGDAWIMVAVEAADHQILIHRSTDLLSWQYLSTFGPLGSTDGVWECPDLFELPIDDGPETAWVMVVSLGPGGPAGRPGTQYFVGDFDGNSFTPHRGDTGRWLDVGPDHYAAVSFDNLPERRIMIGWASNWIYAQHTPTPSWRSSMSLAREVLLRTGPDGRPRLHQIPILPGTEVLQERFTISPAGKRTLRVMSETGQDWLDLEIDAGSGTVRLDRSESGNTTFHDGFATVIDAPLPDHEGAVDVLVVVDASVVEVYALGGALTLTALAFPHTPFTRTELS